MALGTRAAVTVGVCAAVLVAVTGGVGAALGVVGDVVDEVFGDRTEVYGEGEGAFMVASDAADVVEDCGPVKTIGYHDCGDVKVIVLDARRMPFIGRNIKMAWQDGKPGVLTRAKPERQKANRRVVCVRPRFTAKYKGWCDEYPFASTDEGGEGAREEEVPAREQQCQGGSMSSQYGAQQIVPGVKFLVILRHPDAIPDHGFTGKDVGKGVVC